MLQCDNTMQSALLIQWKLALLTSITRVAHLITEMIALSFENGEINNFNGLQSIKKPDNWNEQRKSKYLDEEVP